MDDLKARIIAYRSAMSMAKSMLHLGIITEEEYYEIDTIMTNKYGLSLCTIFR